MKFNMQIGKGMWFTLIPTVSFRKFMGKYDFILAWLNFSIAILNSNHLVIRYPKIINGKRTMVEIVKSNPLHLDL
jgi:hypothetical protein